MATFPPSPPPPDEAPASGPSPAAAPPGTPGAAEETGIASTAAPEAAAAAPAPERHRGWRRLAWVLLPLLLLLLVVAGGLVTTLKTERGTGWLLERVPGLTIEAPRGPLLGDFSARRAEFELGGPDSRVVLEGLSWQGATLGPSASRGWRWPHLHLRSLDIDVLRLQTAPADKDAPKSPPPESLALPLRLQIDALRIGEVQAQGLEPPVRDVKARVDLGGEDGSVHVIDGLALAWDRLRVQGEARIGTAGPLPVQARLAVRQAESAPPPAGTPAAPAAPGGMPPDWNATLRLDGPLAKLPAEARLQAAGQSLDAQAVLTPFAEQPLQTLQTRFAALDLAALHSAAPATALTGSARVRLPEGQADTLPLELSLELRNAAPGLWSEQRLPLRELTLQAAGQARDPASGVTLNRFDALLGTPKEPAGRVQGSGRWTPRQWSAELRIERLEPSALDARAPAMRLSGPLTLRSTAPDSPAAPPPPAPPSLPASPPVAPPAAPGSAAAPPPLSEWPVEVQARLQGRLLQGVPDREVAVVLDGRYSPRELLLRRFEAASGDARLNASGSLVPPDPQQTMQLRLKAEVSRFDPVLWWPGAADSPWRAGPHRLDGRAELDLAVPPRREDRPLTDWLAALVGNATVVLQDSQLAGLPLAAELRAGSASARAPTRVEGRVELAGNRLRWDGGGDLRTLALSPDAPLEFELQAPALARLAPLLRLLGQPADPPPAGALTLTGRAEGRWPALVARGELQGSGLRLPGLQAGKLSGDFRAGLRAGDPLELRFDGRELRLSGGGPIRVAQLQLQGSGLQHQLTLTADAPVTPPWAATRPDAPAQPEPVRLQARLDGGVDVPGAGTPLTELRGWRGTLRQLQLAPLAPQAQPWVRVGEVQAQWRRGGERPRDPPQSLTLSAGRAGILGAAVRWDRLVWQAAKAGRPAVLDARAELEPLLVAPLLRQFQPGFGWAGDLRMGGRLVMRSAAGFQADLELGRVDGDLAVEEGGARQVLGLAELRLAGTARAGVWRFTQQAAGQRLGLLRGEQTVRADPQALWPGAAAPLEGSLSARVADLGTWGAWLPAGWRAGGQLNVDMNIGGRFGAPEYTGVVTGRELNARNVIEGVNLSGGELVVALQGPTAQILTAQARAGEGSVRLEGGATFGASPRAELRVVAENFAALQRVDRRVVASGQARMVLEAESVTLDGAFRVDQALIDISRADAPSLSDDVVVRRRAVDATAPPPPPPSPPRQVAVNVRIDLGDAFRLRGRGLQARLAGDLRMTAPRGRPALNGDIRVVDGVYAAYGQNLVVDRGLISFTGAIENPRLDVLAIRPKLEEVRVGVQVTGTAQNPRIRLFSEPELPETEKLAWLVLGRSYSDLGQAETQLMQTAAMALLAGEGGGGGSTPLTQVTKALGLDTLSFSGPTESGNLRSSVVTLGKQLSDRWYLGYEHSLNATAGSWQLIYRIAERFTLRAQTGDSNALDLIWTWRW